MSKEAVWQILGIDETKDKDKIKQAYREKLIHVNPEDDPEGFMRLRQAFEEANRLADEESTEPEAKTPVELWINEAEAIYKSIHKRLNIDCWRELLDRDICLDLDTESQIKAALTVFLMSNYKFTSEIWFLLEERFDFEKSQEELYEHFPTNFVDFLLYKVKSGEEFMRFDYFRGDEFADYDGFIDSYYAIKKKVDTGDLEEIQADFDALDKYEIFHPFVYVEKLRLCLKDKKIAEAGEIITHLQDKSYDDSYVLFYLGEYKWETGEYEQAFDLYCKVRELSPNFYAAKIGVGKYYFHTGEYEKAKELLLEVMDTNSGDEVARNLLLNINEKIIDNIKDKLKSQPENQSLCIDMGWCFIQNERYDECLDLFKDFKCDDENLFDYNNLMGRTYFYIKKYDVALSYLLKWADGITKLTDKDKDWEKKKKRYPVAQYLLGVSYTELASEKKDTDKYEKALEHFTKAADTVEDFQEKLLYLERQAFVSLKLNKFETCVDTCNAIINLEKNYYPAYLHRQEAYFNLKYGSHVIEDFHNCMNLYPYYVKPFVLAAKVYYIYGENDKAMEVVEKAKEYNLSGNDLEFCYIKLLWRKAKTKAETLEILEKLKKLEENLNSPENDLEDKAEVYYETANAYYYVKEYKNALENINKAVELGENSRDEYLTFKAKIHVELDEGSKALNLYDKLLKKNPDNSFVKAEKAEYLRRTGQIDDALDLSLSIIEGSPNYDYVNEIIIGIYKKAMSLSEDFDFDTNKKYHDEAVAAATRLIANSPSRYAYIERGLLYEDSKQYDLALEDYSSAKELEPESPYPYNCLGDVYKKKGEYRKAIEALEQAYIYKTEDCGLWTVKALAECYEGLGEYEKALEYYSKAADFDGYSMGDKDNYGRMLTKLRRYEESNEHYFKMLTDAEEKHKPDIYYSIAHNYIYDCKPEEGLEYLKKIMKINRRHYLAHICMGDCYYYALKDYKKALAVYQRLLPKMMEGYKFVPSNHLGFKQYIALSTGVIRCYRKLGKEAKVKTVFKHVLDNVGSFDEFIDSNPDNSMLFAFEVFNLFYYMGDYENAEKYYIKMGTYTKCTYCLEQGCYEFLYAKALMLQSQGKIHEAIEYHQKTLDTAINYFDCFYTLQELKEGKNK